MKEKVKSILSALIGTRNLSAIKSLRWRLVNARKLRKNYSSDMKLFYKHSTVFHQNNIKKLEALIILDYHAVEKGMLFEKMKPKFAKERVERLHNYLNSELITTNTSNGQILHAYKVMCKYYEIHQELSLDISSYFTLSQYKKYLDILGDDHKYNFHAIIDFNKEDFYKNNYENFETFARSRKSLRNFTGEYVPIADVKRAVELATTSPSVCNRQASKVYLIEDKVKVNKILAIQKGFRGYEDSITQLLILVNDRNFYYTIGERNQLYIDGGIFLMNLLYSLHFYKIAHCPGNWGKEVKDDIRMSEVSGITENEKVICIIPIGVTKDNFRATLSKRRSVNEIFQQL